MSGTEHRSLSDASLLLNFLPPLLKFCLRNLSQATLGPIMKIVHELRINWNYVTLPVLGPSVGECGLER